MSEIKHRRGQFVWHELFTPDVEAAKTFYSELLGWTYSDDPMPDGDGTYTTLMAGPMPVGGIMPLAVIGQPGVPPHWIPYVSIANIDESAAATAANGGMVAKEPTSIEGVGRFAALGDPQHAYSSCIDLVTGDPTWPEQPSVGMFCWDQLNTTDVEGAAAFYAKVYGWEKKDFPHGGDMWVFHAGETSVASIMKAPDGVPAHWVTYVVVDDLAKARTRVTELGGQVMVEAIPVPEVGTISIIADNAGAMIGLFDAPKGA